MTQRLTLCFGCLILNREQHRARGGGGITVPPALSIPCSIPSCTAHDRLLISASPNIELRVEYLYRIHTGFQTDVRFGKLQEIRRCSTLLSLNSPQTSLSVCTRYGIDDVCNIRNIPKDLNELDFSQQSAQGSRRV